MKSNNTVQNSTIFILDNWGFCRKSADEILDSLARLNRRKLFRLSDDLNQSICEVDDVSSPISETRDLNIFNFLPGSVLRGDSLCRAPECQIKQLRLLSRFGALYADRIVFPIDFPTTGADIQEVREELAHSIISVCELRPLIESGIVRLVKAFSCVCNKCLMRGKVDVGRLNRRAKHFWEDKANQFEITYKIDDYNESVLEVAGPLDFLPHSIFLNNVSIPQLSRRSIKALNSGVNVSPTLARQRNLFEEVIFGSYFRDYLLQQIYASTTASTYLTNSPGQASFFRSLGGDGEQNDRGDKRTNEARFVTSLAHEIPLFSGISIIEALHLRQDDPDSFIKYRAAMNKILIDQKLSKGLKTNAEMNDIYHDELRPKIADLYQTAKKAKRTGLRRPIVKTAATALAVSLGFMTGFLSTPELKALSVTAGGVAFIRDIFEAFMSKELESHELQSNDFYFLLKLTGHQETGY